MPMVIVSKIMSTSVLILKKDAKISDAARLMSNKHHGCVIIVEGKKPIGIITETDLVRNLVSKKSSPNAKVTEIMSSPVVSIEHDAKLEKANKIIDTHHFTIYPVVNKEGSVISIVTENDVVHSINDNIRFHRNLQDAVLIIFVVFEFFVFILYKHIIDIFSFLR